MRSKSPAKRPATRVFGHAAQPAQRQAGSIRPGLFYGCFAALFGTNVLTVVSFLMAPDIAALMTGQNEFVLSAYEDRIAQLRVEVDRLHSRQYAQAGDINLQLQELTQQQEVLIEQHQFVKLLAAKAAELGIETAAVPPPDDDDAALVSSAIAAGRNGRPDLAQAAATVSTMMDETRLALTTLAEAATAATDTILTELGGIGIKPKLPDDLDAGVGGPFLPATTDGLDTTSLVDDANQVYAALARFKAARSAIDLAPIHKPMAGTTRISSNFGNRTDPFTRGKAFHAGIDFPAPTGTIVRSAGYGKVTFVGQKSGYGNVVEITHGTGLVSRYGHLSSFIAKQGQTVETGTPIARVGSTGRSTGPHLHFEVRRKDVAVDPGKYLDAGKRLKRFLGA